MTLEQIWDRKQFTFETLPAFKSVAEICRMLEAPTADDGTFSEGDQLFKLKVGNLEVEAGYVYVSDWSVRVYSAIYKVLNASTNEYELVDRASLPLEIDPTSTLDEIAEQMLSELYGYEDELIINE